MRYDASYKQWIIAILLAFHHPSALWSWHITPLMYVWISSVHKALRAPNICRRLATSPISASFSLQGASASSSLLPCSTEGIKLVLWDDFHCHYPSPAHWDVDRDNTFLTGYRRSGEEGQVLGSLEEDADDQWWPGRCWALSELVQLRLAPSHSCVPESHFHTSAVEGLPLQNLTSLHMLKLTSKDYKKNQRAMVVARTGNSAC